MFMMIQPTLSLIQISKDLIEFFIRPAPVISLQIA